MLDIKKDVVFRYLFSKNSPDNREALKGLIEAFTNQKITSLNVLSPELLYGTVYTKEVRMDILASFNEDKIDIEMQVINHQNELKQRMIYYLGSLISTQIEKGTSYTEVKCSYVLFIFDFNEFDDDQLVHTFILKDKDSNLSFTDDTQYLCLITVELPKSQFSDSMSLQQEYAYVLKNYEDELKNDKIKVLEQRERGIFHMINAVNQISETEREWIKKYDQLRNKLDENQRVENAHAQGLKEGKEIGEAKKEKEMIITLFQSGMDIETIASMFQKEISYVKNIVEEK